MQKEEILREMKRRGKRITEQRKILMDIILENPHNCCKEIYYEAVKKVPSIGIATVYRMMNLLEEIGAVSRFYSYPMYQTNEDMADAAEAGISIRNGKAITPKEQEILYVEMKDLLKKRGLLQNNDQFAATIEIRA